MNAPRDIAPEQFRIKGQQVSNPSNQIFLKSHRPRLWLPWLGVLLLLLSGAFLWPARSGAARRISSNSAQSFPTKRRRPEFVAGEALVRFKKNRAWEGSLPLSVTTRRLESGLLDLSLRSPAVVPVTVERFAGSNLIDGLRVAHMEPSETLTAIAALKARDDVLYAEPNYLLRIEATPNDPFFGQLYGLNLIGAPQAWDLTTGNRNIVVAVIDEGVDVNHP